jgi:DNA topoisomerase-2
MMEKTEAKISEGNGKGFTKITYTPDYAHIETQLDDDNYAKLVKRVYDIAGCNPKLKIYFNGDRIKINSFKDYIALYTPKFEFDENENWSIGVAATDDGFSHVSFVNTTHTIQGGTHLYYVWYQIATKLREYIQKKHKIDVKQTEIQSYMQVFINATIVRPRYDSQTKETLMTEVKDYKTSWECSDKFIKRIIDCGIVDRVLIWAEAKAKADELKRLRDLSKDIDKGNPRRVEKFSDAMEDTDRHLCELYLTEGDSARKSIHEARGKNPYIGSFALKGKPLNVMDCDLAKVIGDKKNNDDGNNEIKNILKITGLKIGVPVKSVKDLRFGKIVILSDQDLDGFHVSSLLINFFAYFWPELFEMGIIYRMATPLVIATVKGKETEFWTDEDYDEWSKTAPKHEATRFKGLGKFKTPRFKKILENRENYLVRIGKLEAVDFAGINLAFKGSMADDRKEWLNDVNYFNNFD